MFIHGNHTRPIDIPPNPRLAHIGVEDGVGGAQEEEERAMMAWNKLEEVPLQTHGLGLATTATPECKEGNGMSVE